MKITVLMLAALAVAVAASADPSPVPEPRGQQAPRTTGGVVGPDGASVEVPIEQVIEMQKARCSAENGLWQDVEHEGLRFVGCVWVIR